MTSAVVLGLGLAGCTPEALPFALPASGELPALPWDGQPEAGAWTTATLMAVRAQDGALAGRVPADVGALCPGYETGSMAERRAFWVALVALTAGKESRFDPSVIAPGGYVGLMQISPRTARAAGCGAVSPAELQDGENNLFCAVQLMAGHVARDGQVLGPQGNRGIGRDWMPWRGAAMQSESADWLKRQGYCQ